MRRFPTNRPLLFSFLAGLGLLLPGLLAFPVSARAGVLFVGDFDEGTLTLDIGGSSTVTDLNNATAAVVAHADATPALWNRGSSLKVDYTTGADSYILLNFGSSQDLRNYAALSFWVRGTAGAERFKILAQSAGSGQPSTRLDVRNYLPAGVTTSWQKVVVPIRALVSDFVLNTSTALSDINAIVLQIDSAAPSETFYLDDFLFHTKAAPVWVDNFNDGAEPGAFGFPSGNYVNGGTGAGFAHVYDTGTSSSSPAGFKITWTTGTALPTEAAVLVMLDSPDYRNGHVAADVSGCDTLAFSVMGDSAQNGQPLGIGLSDDAIDENIHLTTITLTTAWQAVTRPVPGVSGFNLASSTNIAQVQFWFINPFSSGRGAQVVNSTNGVVYVDDIRFLDTQSPTAPSALAEDGTTIANNSFIGITNAVTFTAPTASDDATLESVRFEHDGLTGGATWYTVYINTNTSSASHSFTWNTASLLEGTSYQVRAVAMDVAGNQSATTFTSIEINQACDVSGDSDAPTITHTPITLAAPGQALSVPVSAADNTRVAAVTLFYRTKGTSDYSQVAYTVSSPCNKTFSGTAAVPASAVTSAGVEYYIQATDSKNSATFASAASPQSAAAKDSVKQAEITAAGGTVTLGDSNAADGETSVTIPAGALDETVTVTLTQKSVTEAPSGASIGQDQPFAAFEFGPSGTVFARPVTVTLLYPDADQDGFVESAVTGLDTTVPETGLKIFVYDGAAWRSLGGTVNASQNTVTAQTFHFSTFAVFPASSLTKARLRPPEKIITPLGSPGVNDAAHFGGGAAGAKIEIYDITGRVVRRLYDQTVWDGRDSDGNIVESGVYFYHAEIEGEKVDGSLTVAR